MSLLLFLLTVLGPPWIRAEMAGEALLPDSSPESSATNLENEAGNFGMEDTSPWGMENHVFIKNFYHASRGPDKWHEMGYLRGTVQSTLNYDHTIYLHATGRATAYRSNYLKSEDFSTLWLDNNHYDIWKMESRGEEGSDTFNSLDFRELWVKYESLTWTVKVGRQQINWGEGRFFNPLNPVNQGSPFTLDYTELKGSDSIAATHYFSGNTFLDVVLSFHKSGNYYLSWTDTWRTIRTTELILPPDGFPDIRFSRETLPIATGTVYDSLINQYIRYASKDSGYKTGQLSSLYQDGALRLKTTLTESMDIALIGGWKARRSYGGVDWNGTYAGAGFRAGAIYYSAFQTDPHGANLFILNDDLFRYENRAFVQAYAGVDYTFSQYFGTGLQYFYNGGALIDKPFTLLGITRQLSQSEAGFDRDVYDLMRINPMTLRHHYLSTSVGGDLTGLVRYDFFVVYEAEGGGVLAMPILTINPVERLQWIIGGQYFNGGHALSDFTGLESAIYMIAEYTVI